MKCCMFERKVAEMNEPKISSSLFYTEDCNKVNFVNKQ